jgi:Tfp pilus assembly protein PilF
MSRLHQALSALIAMELGIGVAILRAPPTTNQLPMPSMVGYHPDTERRVRTALADCDTAEAASVARVAEMLMSLGLYPESEASWRHAISLKPGDPDLRFNHAACLSSMGKIREAREELSRALELGHRREPDCWYFIGREWLREERSADAQAAFTSAQDLPAAQFELAKLDVRDGNAEQALPVIRRMQQAYPEASRVHLLRAQAARIVGDTDEAVRYEELSNLTYGELPGPWRQLQQRLIQLYEEHSPRRIARIAHQALQSGRVSTAETLLAASEDSTWEPYAADVAADVAAAKGDLPTHRARLERIIELDGADSYRLCRLGFALLASDDPVLAEQAFRDGVSLAAGERGNELRDMCEQLAVMAERRRDVDAALRWRGLAREYEGLALFRQTQYRQAMEKFREAVALDAGRVRAWYYLGECCRLLEQPEPARQAYGECLRRDPHFGRAERALSRLLLPGDAPATE